jgi:hypothetical protein
MMDKNIQRFHEDIKHRVMEDMMKIKHPADSFPYAVELLLAGIVMLSGIRLGMKSEAAKQYEGHVRSLLDKMVTDYFKDAGEFKDLKKDLKMEDVIKEIRSLKERDPGGGSLS